MNSLQKLPNVHPKSRFSPRNNQAKVSAASMILLDRDQCNESQKVTQRKPHCKSSPWTYRKPFESKLFD